MLTAMRMTGATLSSLTLALTLTSGAAERDYHFDGKISREVLENYLSRAVTFTDFFHGKGSVADNLRFLTNTGAKFVGRAIYRWGGEDALPALLETAKPIARQAHAADPDMVLQAACFEIVTASVGKLPVPGWLFREFGLPVEQRTFRYEAMLYPDGRRKDQWGNGGSVPDISQLETRMWFLFLAASYIDLGVEAIHFGQVEIMDQRDKDHVHWRDLLTRVRAHAAQHARRHFVLCDAHVPSGGIVHDGRLLLDFHSFPLRVAEVPDKPQEGVLKMGHLDTIYGRSKGGLTPSGWPCAHLPYLVELDNYGVSALPGQHGPLCTAGTRPGQSASWRSCHDRRNWRFEGWSCDAGQPGDKYWKADQSGSVIEFEVAGQVVLLMDWHIRGPMGQASVRVDERPPEMREGWFDQTWGGYRQTTVLARDLGPGKHKVRIELLPEKNPQSTGHEFRLLGLGVAGVEREN
jgi:hypothetical protein